MLGRGCYHSAPKEIWGRRDFIRVGSLGLLGLNLADFFRLRSAAAAGPERSCILIWLSGGPPHQDLWDMKPDAPTEFRGIYKPIPTNVPGIRIGELLPHTAKVADKYTIIRSMTGPVASPPGRSTFAATPSGSADRRVTRLSGSLRLGS